jgi:hypothetical protein
MDYQQPTPAPALCIRQASKTIMPDRFFIAFNDGEAQVFTTDQHAFFTSIVADCPPKLFPLF